MVPNDHEHNKKGKGKRSKKKIEIPMDEIKQSQDVIDVAKSVETGQEVTSEESSLPLATETKPVETAPSARPVDQPTEDEFKQPDSENKTNDTPSDSA